MTTSAKQELRDLIAAKLAERRSLFNDYPITGELADAVMELFREDITESWEVRGVDPDFGDEEWAIAPPTAAKVFAAAREARAAGSTARVFRVFEIRTAVEAQP